MGKRISVDQLESEIKKILNDYAHDSVEALDAAADKISKAAVSELKSASPVGGETKTPGRYKKGWTKKKERTRLGVNVTIYNATDGALTHLLEKGHALRQGGRSPSVVHIKPVEESATKTFEQDVKNKLESL